jgi:putative DNA primase/helicase
MASRFVILVLQESFIGREDLELESKLEPELPAILNWAIEGRRRLLERGRFFQPQSGEKLVEQMSELSSTVARFVRECCVTGAERRVLKADLYKAWQSWCGTNGQRVTDSALFGRDLSAACARCGVYQSCGIAQAWTLIFYAASLGRRGCTAKPMTDCATS